MKLTFKSYPKTGYESAEVKGENSRYHFTRLEDDTVAFTSKCPQADSEYWDETKYFAWDNEDDCEALPEAEEEAA